MYLVKIGNKLCIRVQREKTQKLVEEKNRAIGKYFQWTLAGT